MLIRLLTLCFLLFSASLVKANNKEKYLDSLKSIWDDHSLPDSARIGALQMYAWYGFIFTKPDSAFHYAQLVYDFAEAKDITSYLQKALNTQGSALYLLGRYDESLKLHHKGMQFAAEQRDKKGEARSLNNIGLIHHDQGNYRAAVVAYLKSLSLKEQLDDRSGVARTLGNIGLVHKDQGNHEEALVYHLRSLKISETLTEGQNLSTALNNIGGAYHDLGDLELALTYHNRALVSREKENDQRGISHSLINLGQVYLEKGILAQEAGHRNEADTFFTKAEKRVLRAGSISEITGDKQSQSRSLLTLGLVYSMQERYSLSIINGKKALEIGTTMKNVNEMKNAHECLYRAYKAKRSFDESLHHYEEFIRLKDTISSEANKKNLIRSEIKYDFEKAQLLEEHQNQENQRIATASMNRRDNLQYSIIFIALLVVFGGVISLGFIKASPKVAEGLIFFSFLILFEFVLVLMDPYIDNYTAGAPGYKLLFNAVLAGLIFPLHTFFEKKLKFRLIRKS